MSLHELITRLWTCLRFVRELQSLSSFGQEKKREKLFWPVFIKMGHLIMTANSAVKFMLDVYLLQRSHSCNESRGKRICILLIKETLKLSYFWVSSAFIFLANHNLYKSKHYERYIIFIWLLTSHPVLLLQAKL